MLASLIFGATLASFLHVEAQTPAYADLKFDVATIKPANLTASSSNLNLNSDRIVSQNLPLTFLLQFAFGLNSGSTDQLLQAPSWLESQRFDIVAKEDEATAALIGKLPAEERTAAQRALLRSLLEQRFQLRVHQETRNLPVLALVVARDGPKLVPVSPSSNTPSAAAEHWEGLHNPGRGRTQGRAATVSMLVDALSTKPEVNGRLVVDRTGLQGKYNFDLNWTPKDLTSGADSEAGGPSLFTALQEQHGLKLESRKAPVDCIVIDHIEQPSPN